MEKSGLFLLKKGMMKMSLYAIGDLHLSFGSDKPMDKFGENWKDHPQKIFNNWQAAVNEDDTVVLCGDSSWAIDFEELLPDFEFINNLNGKKIILKGNHDYWWSTISKLNNFCKEKGFDKISFLFNNSYNINNISVCGTRGWPCDEDNESDFDNKILARETGRLKLSLDAALPSSSEKIAFLHYPPVYEGFRCPEILDMLEQYNVKRCYYGHLHDASVKKAFEGTYRGTEYKLISCDYTNFHPVLIER